MGLLGFIFPRNENPFEGLDPSARSVFPKGEKDIDAGTRELLDILDHSVDYRTARALFVRSVMDAWKTGTLNKEQLTMNLREDAPHFSKQQFDQFYEYLVALSATRIIEGRPPCEIRRVGDHYLW